jgi:tRNA-dihydrouridine synthase A
MAQTAFAHDAPRPAVDRRFSVAPMMACTDRHDRYFLRLISRHVLLYTEMVTTGALLHGDRASLLAHHPLEHPLALQIGGSDPLEMARCARAAESAGFDEINVNVGCPSDRVRRGRFGACLMLEPAVVAECVAAMRAAAGLPVTVKTRIGVDHDDDFGQLERFVDTVATAGCATFIVHARKAWLSGLSPKENREIPPLRHDVVHALKARFPQLEIVLNGGITTLAEARAQLAGVDGVMIGREAYRNPYLLAAVDGALFGDRHAVPTRREIVEQLLPYVEREMAIGTRLNAISRHILGLYHGVAGARAWRRHLSTHAHHPGAGAHTVRAALEQMPPDL